MPDPQLGGTERALDFARSYRSITRHSDGRIIHVRDIEAGSDAEAIQIATARGSDFPMDLWGEEGLIRRFGQRDPDERAGSP